MAAGQGDHALAAMMDVHATVRALDPLLDKAIEESATVVAPCGLVEGSTFELVGAWLLQG